MPMITDSDDFFTRGCGRCDRFATPDCSARQWSQGLDQLRRICLGMDLQETVKWAHPVYMFAGRNIALLGAFRDDFRLTFMNAGLLEDTERVLEPQGPNSRSPSMLRFISAGQVAVMTPVIQAYLQQLMDHAKAGTKPPKIQSEIPMPDELGEALGADPELSEAYYALTPGRQRSYMFSIAQAKKPATRNARIEKFRDKILAGKGAMER
ncbi:YdeI/OmpD-associated family protein [Leisingera thetidis]|uniref:YdeI/OmpD-associated family protein n=1 Tax=Leisingera thetidis TaxID=2930199 RepID=UPI0021F7B980|nr:YdeI/OmpD-associated family protein [Leisingera thetidis]